MTIQSRERQPATPAAGEKPLAAVAHRFRSRRLAQPGLLLKRLVLAAGAVYFAMVATTNAVNFIASAGDFHWTFLNSGNAAYIASITKIYSWPAWTALLMPVIIAVVPDRILTDHEDREIPSGAPGQTAEKTTMIA